MPELINPSKEDFEWAVEKVQESGLPVSEWTRAAQILVRRMAFELVALEKWKNDLIYGRLP